MCDDCHSNVIKLHERKYVSIGVTKAYINSASSDLTIAKVLKLSEVAQIARAELRLRSFLEGKWNARKAEAVKVAVKMAKDLKPADKIAAAIANVMNKWAKDVTATFNTEIVAVYRLARLAGYKKATKQSMASLQFNVPKTEGTTSTVKKAKVQALPSFDLVDEEAVQALKDKNTFWIGEHYDTNLSNSISDTTREAMIEAGQSPAVAGQLMADRVKAMLGKVVTPKGFIGTEKQYFEGLVANAMTVGRVYGQMRSFAEVGITRYTITNPGGTRICAVCDSLQGKTFSLQQGLNQIEQEFMAKSPEDIKAIHPWPRSAKAVEGKDEAALAAAGFSLPPYHFRCRCTVDVSDEVGSYSDLQPMDFPTSTRPVRPKEIMPPGVKKESAEDKIIRNLLTSRMISAKQIGKGVNGAQMATLQTPDQTKVKAVWKTAESEMSLRRGIEPGTYHAREAAMYKIDREMGGTMVVPPTVSRDPGVGKIGSLQHYVPGAKDMDDVGSAVRSMAYAGQLNNDPRIRRMFLLDVIGANDDRHTQNIMFKAVKRGGKTAYNAIAIDNGLTFPKGMPARYIFPTDAPSTLADSLVKLDRASVLAIRKLKLERVAQVLREAGVPSQATMETLIRIRALQINPQIIDKMPEYNSTSKVMEFFSRATNKPLTLVKPGDREKIIKIVGEAYKDAGAAPQNITSAGQFISSTPGAKTGG